jgi:hypothetical protein
LRDWIAHVNTPPHEKDLKRLRRSVRRGTPFANGSWTEATARHLGLEDTLRPRGRSRKADREKDFPSSPPTLFSGK